MRPRALSLGVEGALELDDERAIFRGAVTLVSSGRRRFPDFFSDFVSMGEVNSGVSRQFVL